MPEYLRCEQGTAEWERARLGIPTASAFGRIVTPTGKLSAQRTSYMGELLAEWALGEPYNEFQTEWMERGKILEPEARRYYAFQRDAEPTEVGFIYKCEKHLVGASPDSCVDEDGLLEIKCPKASTHLLWLSGARLPAVHAPQVQGQLWVAERSWCDFLSYHPGLPPLLVRVEPDEKYQAALDEHMPTFIDEMLRGRDSLVEQGVIPEGDIKVSLHG